MLGDPEVIGNQTLFRELSREFAHLNEVVTQYQRWKLLQATLADAQEMLNDADPELRILAEDEITDATTAVEEIESALQLLLLPQDPNDTGNVFLEIRAGTGGDEAAIFSGDLFRMYHRYAEQKGWSIEIMSERAGDHGGYKELITRVIGQDVYAHLKFESGAHRVQRVPETEAQGRVHTSTVTVAVLPEAEEVDIDINPADLRIDVFRASGAGGQHVNRTESAVRITHLPTDTVVQCQNDRSQHKNKAQAMNQLRARLFELEMQKRRAGASAVE